MKKLYPIEKRTLELYRRADILLHKNPSTLSISDVSILLWNIRELQNFRSNQPDSKAKIEAIQALLRRCRCE